MAWQSFNNSLSVDITSLKSNAGNDMILGGPMVTSVIANLQDRVNLYPFKIVTLDWLISQGKYISFEDYYKKHNSASKQWALPVNYFNPSNINVSVNVYIATFDNKDTFLPLGDLVIPNDSKLDLTQIPVVLVANDGNGYSYIIPNSPNNLKLTYDGFFSKTADFGLFQDQPLTSNINIFQPQIVNKQGYSVIGQIVRLQAQNVTDGFEQYFPIAAVNNNFLTSGFLVGSNADGFNLGLNTTETTTAYYMYTSPYFTFGAQMIYGGAPPMIGFDIVPGTLMMDVCSGNLPTSLQGTSYQTYITNKFPVSSTTCNSLSHNFCQNSNLLLDQCYNYCKTNDCTTVLASYCGSSDNVDVDNAKILNNDANFNQMCACNLPTQYYQNWKDKLLSKIPSADQEGISTILQQNMINPQCFYPTCNGNSSYLPVPHQTCPAYNIMNCINNSNLNTQGADISDQASLDAASYIKCNQNVQQSQTTSTILTPPTPVIPSSTPPSTPPSTNNNQPPPPAPKPSSDKTKTIVGGILGVFTVILVLVLVYYFLVVKRK